MGEKEYRRNWVVIGRLSRGEGEVKRPKALVLSYCAKVPLIQITRDGHLRVYKNFEGFTGAAVENNS